MKLSRVLITAAALLPLANAWALTTAQVAALTPANIIYVSGSTATDSAIKAYFKLNPTTDTSAPCAAGTFDLYTTATGYVLTCTAAATFGTYAGTNFAIAKQTAGGSAVGIHNVAAGVAAAQMPDLTNATTFAGTCTQGTQVAASGPFMAYFPYTCTQAESAVIVPNAGISDEDPTTWIGTGPVTASDATFFGSAGAVHGVEVPFGIVVNKALRNQLQTAEGLTSGSDTLANVPSLSTAQIRALLTSNVLDWGAMWVWNPVTSAMTKVGNDTSTGVHVCRRGDTSGSQFAANIFFTGKGCTKGNGVPAISNPDDSTTQANGEAWTGGTDTDGNVQVNDAFFAGSGTGDVLKCVGSTLLGATGGLADTVDYKIGFASMDQQPIVAGVDGNWRFIAVDGVAPTIWNIQTDRYSWIVEDTFNSTAATLSRNGATNGATIFTKLEASISNVNALAGLNAAAQNNVAPGTTDGSGDGGIVTIGNAVLYGTSDAAGPSAPTWPAAIRAIATAGQGPNSPIVKQYPGAAALNNCNGAVQGNPTGY